MAELAIRVTPRASRTEVGNGSGLPVPVRVCAPPAEGEANRAALEAVANALGVPKSRLRLASGQRSREKRIEVEGLELPEILERLSRHQRA